MNNMTPKFEGYIDIYDGETGEHILSKKNGIHYENMSLCLAKTLSHQGYGHIDKMYFGNGASTVTGTGAISYFPPNTTGSDSMLYNPTYTDKVVDGNSPMNNDTDRNFIEVSHIDGETFTDLIVHCFLDFNEPSGQEYHDDAENTESQFVFDEIGLVSYPENGEGEGKLLTHVIFSPVQKSLNRSFEIKYTVRIYMSE